MIPKWLTVHGVWSLIQYAYSQKVTVLPFSPDTVPEGQKQKVGGLEKVVEGQRERISSLEAELRAVQGALSRTEATASTEKVNCTNTAHPPHVRAVRSSRLSTQTGQTGGHNLLTEVANLLPQATVGHVSVSYGNCKGTEREPARSTSLTGTTDNAESEPVIDRSAPILLLLACCRERLWNDRLSRSRHWKGSCQRPHIRRPRRGSNL